MAAVAAASLAAVLSAGCAADREPAPPADGGVSPGPAGAHGGFAECLTANGVPGSAAPAAVLGPPAGVDPGTWDKAMQACSTLAPGPAGP